MLKNLLWILTLSCLGFSKAFGQAPTPVVEYIAHYGNYGDGQDLTGYVTYRVYLQFSATAVNPALGSIYAAVADIGPTSIINVNTDCGNFFQHDFGGPTVEPINCALLNVYPSLRYDSFFTVGNLCKAPGNAALNTITLDLPLLQAWENDNNDGNYFDGPNAMTLSNTAFFHLPVNDVLNIPDANDRVLIGQFTTCGNLCMTYSIQYYNNYTGPNGVYETALQTVCFDHPCLSMPMDTDPAVTAVDCFGDPTQVVFGDGGYNGVDYTLYNGGTIGSGTVANTYTNQTSGLTINSLAPGTYYATMIDDAGCRDTSAVFTISIPDELLFDATLTQDILCFGDNNGEIQVSCSGGTGTLVVDVNGTGSYPCGSLITDLTCGNKVVTVTDENGCQETETIVIACPTDIVATLNSTNIPCFGYDNGTITGTVTGGTGTKTVDLILNSGVVNTVNGTGTVNVNFTNLDSGIYTVLVTDANGCTETVNITITEPAEFSATTTTEPTICFGSCNGSVSFEIVGGTPAFTTVVRDASNVIQNNLNALCAGDYTWTITDGNDCDITGEFIVEEPADLTYELEVTDESCFGYCDGVISLTNVAGGTGAFDYVLTPNSGICQAPCSGTNITYTALCNGTYSIRVTDEAGCINQINSIVVVSPPQVVITLTPVNVSCFGFADGSVTVSGSGGTGGDLFSGLDGALLPVTYENLAPNNYAYTILDANGCAASDDVQITEPEVLEATFVSAEDVSCGGACDGSANFLVVGGTAPYGYLLNPNGTTGSVNNTIGSLCADDYELIIEDLQGCLDTITFSVNEPPEIDIDVQLDRPTCTGMFDGAAIIEVNGGTGELTTIIEPNSLEIISTGDTIFDILNLGETVIILTVYDENQCSIRDSIEVVPDLITNMVLNTFSSPETCWDMQDGTATVAVQYGFGPLTYQWDDPNMQTTAIATNLVSSETYTVIVTDSIGCTLSTEVFIEPTIGCFYITNAITPNGDGSNDLWLIGGLEFFPNAKVQVFNRWGQVVFESTGYPSAWDGSYKGEPLPVADYYYIIDYSEEADPIMGTVTIKY